ncbi:site-specific integrase [Brevundimonas sp.]|uniref:site-specific integrase n=1 Tax=Brevundimonas sp. TaxID=1871086 RepID=UPI002899230B|nr:site-specific integrase [Brevundimonas sp.]
MAKDRLWGVYRIKDPKTGRLGQTWFVRRDVPADVRERLGRRVWNETTGTTDLKVALKIAEARWRGWSDQIAQARALGAGPVMSLANATAAVDQWRRMRCRAASGGGFLDHLIRQGVAAYMAAPGAGISADLSVDLPGEGIDAADYYFEKHPSASRAVETPISVQMLVARLVPSLRDPEAYAQLPEFDGAMDQAISDGGGAGVLPSTTRQALRTVFANAWLEVIEAEEAERRRAAMSLAARAPDSVLRDQVGRPAFQARVGDLTIGQVIAKYQAERDGDDTEKQYGHIFRALKQLVGEDKPIRAVTRDDVLTIKRTLAQIPKNMTKLYGKDVDLIDAIERGADEDKPRLAPNTLRSYMVNLSAVMNFAWKKLGVIDQNPVDGLIPKRQKQVERRAFRKDELDLIFGGLQQDREADSAHYWVPALLTFTGCRANEICQLRVEDVDRAEGIDFIDLTLFGKDGVRVGGKRLKNESSARAVPIHQELVRAGFLEFVERRRAAGEERLFPELTQNAFGRYSHEVSRRFGQHLDRVGLPEPSLVLHGLRHGFRNACRAASLPTEIADGLGGWAGKGEGENYGSRAGLDQVISNAEHMSKLTMGGFKLPA